jgi:Ca2+-binding RTX toxin-like protein
MAKLKYLGASGVLDEAGNFYTYEGGEFTVSGEQTAVWTVTGGSHNTIMFKGTGLAFENGVLVGGEVRKILLEDFEGADIAIFSGNYNAVKLGAALEKLGADDFLEYASRGNDVMIGTGRDDYIEGHRGNDTIKGGEGDDVVWGAGGTDRLIGGAGNDYFTFETNGINYKGDRNDVVVDFDANLIDGGQDYILADWNDVISAQKDGNDTVVVFGDHGSFTLLGVKRADIDESDFAMI